MFKIFVGFGFLSAKANDSNKINSLVVFFALLSWCCYCYCCCCCFYASFCVSNLFTLYFTVSLLLSILETIFIPFCQVWWPFFPSIFPIFPSFFLLSVHLLIQIEEKKKFCEEKTVERKHIKYNTQGKKKRRKI